MFSPRKYLEERGHDRRASNSNKFYYKLLIQNLDYLIGIFMNVFFNSFCSYSTLFLQKYEELSGKKTFPNGDIWEGEFKDGKLNGQGKKTFVYEGEVEKVYEGEFKEGELNGQGKITFFLKGFQQIFEGEFIDSCLKQGRKTIANVTEAAALDVT
jgi:hypothetical protein